MRVKLSLGPKGGGSGDWTPEHQDTVTLVFPALSMFSLEPVVMLEFPELRSLLPESSSNAEVPRYRE